MDDLQWADSSSLELLVFLVHRGKSRVYGAYRANEIGTTLEQTLNSLGSSGNLTTIHLPAFEMKAIRELLADLIGIAEGPERFSRWLFIRSNGNVFFALEMLKSLFENGVLEVRDGDWHTALDEITVDYSELEVPPRVAQLIARRFARLGDATQRLLNMASVIGTGFDAKILSSLVGLSEMATIEGLEEAEKHGFIVARGFSHDLFRQCLYKELPTLRRQYLHANVAQAISGRAQPLIVAEHWRKAGQLEQAWKLELTEAKHQFERGLLTAGFETLASLLNAPNTQALRLEALILAGTYTIYLDLDRSDNMLLEALNTPEISPEQRLHTNLSLSDNAVYRGDMAAAIGYIEQASQYIRADTSLEFKLMYDFARLEAMLRSGQFAAADALLPEVYALESNNLKTSSYEAQLRFYQGQHHRAAQIFERMRNQDPNCVYTLSIENDLAVSYWWLGQLKQAEQEILLSLEHWQGSAHVEALSFMNLGFIRLSQGRFSDALDALRRAKEIGTAFGSLTYEGDIENRLGVIYFHAGRFSEALPHSQKSVELLRKVGDPYRLLTALSNLVSVNAVMGDLKSAKQNLLEAEKLLEHTQNQAAKVFLIQGKALIELATGNPKRASAYALKVETFAREFELQEFLCMALFFRAKLEPEPTNLLNEMLELSEKHGFVFQQFLAANALNDTARVNKNLKFLRQHSPQGWF
jgi:tetratricopeptide (TPR) repeat protein